MNEPADRASNTVLVTGAAMGIGRGVAEVLTEQGKNLVLFDLNADALATTVRELGGKAASKVGSVTSLADCEDAVRIAIARFGGLDGVARGAERRRQGAHDLGFVIDQQEPALRIGHQVLQVFRRRAAVAG